MRPARQTHVGEGSQAALLLFRDWLEIGREQALDVSGGDKGALVKRRCRYMVQIQNEPSAPGKHAACFAEILLELVTAIGVDLEHQVGYRSIANLLAVLEEMHHIMPNDAD